MMAGTPPLSQPAADQPKFEEILRRLEQIVRDLEEGEIGLDEALARYEEGIGLLRKCHDILQRVERRIELLSGVDAAGNPICAPLDEPTPSLEEKGARRAGRRSPPKLSPRDNRGENEVDDVPGPS